jgi:hypothetical protein|tara:strand:+ start:1207 stop:1896 length:690 start_codon:yes stop_codon:yes gene_type:complete
MSFQADKVGRIWLDEDSFLAPFGHFKKDWEYVYNYFNDPVIAKRLFHDGMDFNLAISIAETQIKSNPAFIGFYKNKRSAYIILEQISAKPVCFVLHGGISRKLYGSGLPQLAFNYVKQFVFEERGAEKLEGIIMHPNKLLEGYFKRGGLTKECEIKNRVSVDSKLFPIKLFGMTLEDYKNTENKESENGWRRKTISPSGAKSRTGSTSTNRSTKKRNRKANRRKKHKRR